MPSATPVQIVGSNGTQITDFGGGGSTANPSVTSEKAPASLATGQVSVTTSSTLVAAARAGRKSITLTPTSSLSYAVGNTGVTTGTGLFVPAGASITISTEAAVYAVGGAAVTISYIETF